MLHDLSVFVKGFREDQDVVEIDSDLSFSNKIAEDVIHHPLECGGQIGKSEEHDCGFEQSSIRMEGGLFFVTLSDSDIVVSPMNVELCEILGTTKLVDELRNER